jgi:hypothetical protein
MQIVLDSSVIVAGDWDFQNPSSQDLLAWADRGEIEVLMPQVVYEEVVNKRREMADSDKPWEYGANLWRTLMKSSVRFLEYPDISHVPVIERALARRPPFDSSGRKGYRDVLIWHNLLEVARSDQRVVLVAADKVFQDPRNAARLTPPLADEMRDLGLDPSRVVLANSISEACEQIVGRSQGILGQLRSLMIENGDWMAGLTERLEALATTDADIVGAEVNVGLDSASESFVDEIREERLDYVDDFERITVADAAPRGRNLYSIDIWAAATAFYDVEVLVSERVFESDDPGAASRFDFGLDGPAAWTTGAADEVLVFSGIYDPSSRSVSDLELRRVTSEVDGEPAKLQLPRERRCKAQNRRPKREREIVWRHPMASAA